MLVGRIFKGNDRRIGWAAECEVAHIWTQGLTKEEAMFNIAEVLEMMVDKPGFKATVTELGPDPRGGITVWVEGNDPSLVVSRVLFEQRITHRLSLADVAAKLGASSRNAYASYEQGRRDPSLGKLLELLAVVAPELGLVIAPRAYLGGLSRGLERPKKKTTNGAKPASRTRKTRNRPSRASHSSALSKSRKPASRAA
jgi:transcriptional regulator with XRE-family HTH domain